MPPQRLETKAKFPRHSAERARTAACRNSKRGTVRRTNETRAVPMVRGTACRRAPSANARDELITYHIEREERTLTLGSGSAGPGAAAAMAMHRQPGRGRAAARRPGARTTGEGAQRRRRIAAAWGRATARVAVAADMDVLGAGKAPREWVGAACARLRVMKKRTGV
jgi:hypothetical protein